MAPLHWSETAGIKHTVGKINENTSSGVQCTLCLQLRWGVIKPFSIFLFIII